MKRMKLSIHGVLFSIIFFLVSGCSTNKFKSRWTTELAPESFTVVFETTKGNIEIEVERKLSPKAVDRFYQLTKHSYFTDNYFYRTIPEFVAQFGSYDTVVYNAWDNIKVPDEPVIQGNYRGTISFGRSGKESRGTDLYINLVDNNRLDTLYYDGVRGFPTFGKITNGLDILDKLYSGYGRQSMDSIELMYTNMEAFSKHFPKLDKINKAYITAN
ncbi:MAG: peptidylprolyl isomerase [Bacteroidota bacterium]